MHKVPPILSIPLMALFASCGSPKPASNDLAPLSIQWKKLGQLPADRLDHQQVPNPGLAGPVAGISGDYLIIGGGSNFPNGLPWEGGKKKYYRKLYIYKLGQNPDTATLISSAVSLPYAVGYPACLSTANGIVVAGGENEKGPTDKVMLIKMDPDKASGVPVMTELPALPTASSGAMITALGDKVYYAGGTVTGGNTSDQFLLLDLKNSSLGWQKLPALPQPTSFGILYNDSVTGKLYLASGRKSNPQARTTFFSTMFVYDTSGKTWQKKSELPYPVSAATGIRYQDKLLLFGGDQGEVFHQTEDLLLQIASATDSTSKRSLIEQKNNLQKHHPGFTHQILAYDLKTDRWDLATKLTFKSQVTTIAIPWKDKVIIPCGEIRAGVRYPDIIIGAIQPTP